MLIQSDIQQCSLAYLSAGSQRFTRRQAATSMDHSNSTHSRHLHLSGPLHLSNKSPRLKGKGRSRGHSQSRPQTPGMAVEGYFLPLCHPAASQQPYTTPPNPPITPSAGRWHLQLTVRPGSVLLATRLEPKAWHQQTKHSDWHGPLQTNRGRVVLSRAFLFSSSHTKDRTTTRAWHNFKIPIISPTWLNWKVKTFAYKFIFCHLITFTSHKIFSRPKKYWSPLTFIV